MARVGLCEDDPQVSRVVQEALTGDGHEVVVTFRGAEALRVFPADPGLQALVLDIGLPDSDGRDVCQALRAGGVHDIVSGFGAGGDDYLVKPFAVAELRARVTALARRAPEPTPVAGQVQLDPVRFSLRLGDREAVLTPTEFRLLATLFGRPGEVVRRRELVAAAWPLGAVVQENTLDSYLRRLRQRLEDIGAPGRIETVRGVGYVVR
jgi:two-component system response regulator MprA